MKKTRHFYTPLVLCAAFGLLVTAFMVGQDKYEAYQIDHQEEIRSIYIEGHVDGYIAGWGDASSKQDMKRVPLGLKGTFSEWTPEAEAREING